MKTGDYVLVRYKLVPRLPGVLLGRINGGVNSWMVRCPNRTDWPAHASIIQVLTEEEYHRLAFMYLTGIEITEAD